MDFQSFGELVPIQWGFSTFEPHPPQTLSLLMWLLFTMESCCQLKPVWLFSLWPSSQKLFLLRCLSDKKIPGACLEQRSDFHLILLVRCQPKHRTAATQQANRVITQMHREAPIKVTAECILLNTRHPKLLVKLCMSAVIISLLPKSRENS